VSPPEAAAEDPADGLLAIYDRAVPEVYGYLLPRCPNRTVAEDLTAETFLAAVSAVQRDAVPHMSVAWLVGVARHKLVDHWRRQGREERRLRAVESEVVEEEDPWDRHLDAHRAHEVLAVLGPHHRAALTLRYLDALPVPEVADLLGRSTTATETLLVRAKAAFRRAYDDGGDDA
jgi:RNA polymerase sigma-70 factor, ECF subfamily